MRPWRRSKKAKDRYVNSYFVCDYPVPPVGIGDVISIEDGTPFTVTRIQPVHLPGMLAIYGQPL